MELLSRNFSVEKCCIVHIGQSSPLTNKQISGDGDKIRYRAVQQNEGVRAKRRWRLCQNRENEREIEADAARWNGDVNSVEETHATQILCNNKDARTNARRNARQS